LRRADVAAPDPALAARPRTLFNPAWADRFARCSWRSAMPRRATLVPVVALLLSGATLPVASHAAAPKAGLGACVGIEDAQERLACYDRAYGRNVVSKTTATAAPAAAATAARAAPAPAAPKDPVAEFGLTEAAKQAKDPAKAAAAAAAPTSVTAKVISIRFKKYGEFVVTLDNGQVWEQNEPMPSAIVRVGDAVTVKKAVLGSYTLVTAARVATKVHRVD
jgi:hypothetical protein